LRVLSYNVKALNARHRVNGFVDIAEEIVRHQPDIVALQDAQGLLEDVEDDMPMPAPPIFGLPHVVGLDQYVIASKYPLSDCEAGKLGREEPVQQFLRCKANVNGRQLVLVTTHFVSPRSSLSAARRELTDGLDGWIYNLSERLVQANVLLKQLIKQPRPLIVMGDFNASEESPVVQTLELAGLRNTFSQAGKGWGYTHGHALDRKIDFLRIDHILASQDLSILTSEVGGGEASEHNPVFADLVIGP
jgi:endonuclease/exonuclease/phosphatase family metal-dependent hydrolase